MRLEPFDAFDRFTEHLASERQSGRIHLDSYIRDHEFQEGNSHGDQTTHGPR